MIFSQEILDTKILRSGIPKDKLSTRMLWYDMLLYDMTNKNLRSFDVRI